MECTICSDFGIVRLKYFGGEADEFALCLCAAGLAWRNSTNAGRPTFPLWHVWAARERVEHDRIAPIEAFYESAEIATMFPDVAATDLDGPGADDAIIAAMQTRKIRL